MKKIAIYLSILASVTFSACELNESPEFNDADAFVALAPEKTSVAENAGTFIVSVRLTSLAAKTSTIAFEIIDSTAVQGRDFELNGGATTLTFDGSNPVQNIKFNIISHEGEFTGDRVFGIKITNGGSVNVGSKDVVYLTILDLDHPLSFILGEFTATATSYFNGTEAWTVTLSKDISDTKKVWITNLVAGGSSASTPVFGIVNDEKTEIKIPVGQTIATSSSYPTILLEGYYGPDGEVEISDGESITGLIDPNGTIHIQDEFGSHVYNASGASAGWYNIFQADGVFTKK
ncbi:hypothetical protein FACS189440_14890 [Bacteroidia bacterium]|nr:hypothetical protein FACS189423_11570 [Bacteroidia bacterium]GHT49335.1 hypothetical protein FACS189440_14890 [Bacteroidia bacterium]